jgi:hypothetical protein
MKPFPIVLLAAFSVAAFEARAQSIVGTWQLVRQTTCVESVLQNDNDDDTNSLVNDLESMSGGTNSVIHFKDDHSGDESIRMLNERRSAKRNNFLYKYDNGKLYILDKRSKLLIGSYDVDRLSADSLIFSNASRACETRMFIRLSDQK